MRIGRTRGAVQRGIASFSLALVLLCACAHYPPNEPLASYSPTYGYRVSATAGDTDDSTQLLMSVTFSGGGTRAAAFAFGVLEALHATEIEFDGKRRRMSDEIDLLSSVSGGSVTAAYFALNGERTFASLPERWLYHDVQRDLTLRMFSPRSWMRLLSPHFGRSEIAAEYLEQRLFHGATFADLIGNNAPATILNATDMTLGARFSFDQEEFDSLCSDLSRFPIARAVAASFAVPVLFSPVTLRNYSSESCGYTLPDWARAELERGFTTTRRYQEASRLDAYVGARAPRFVHLIDGGVADNLGLRGTIERSAGAGGFAELVDSVGFRRFRRVVHIVVNAQTELGVSWGDSERSPGLFSTVWSSATVPINRYNCETVEAFRESQASWLDAVRRMRCDGPAKMDVLACADIDAYFIEVSFAQHPDAAERTYLGTLPTTFRLSREQVDRVRAAAGLLLRSSPEFVRLVNDLPGSAR